MRFQRGSMTRSNVPGWRSGVPPNRRLKRLNPSQAGSADGSSRSRTPQRSSVRVPASRRPRCRSAAITAYGPRFATERRIAGRGRVQVPGAIARPRRHSTGEQTAVVLGQREEPVAARSSARRASAPRKSRDRRGTPGGRAVSTSSRGRHRGRRESALPHGSAGDLLRDPPRRSSARASFDQLAIGSSRGRQRDDAGRRSLQVVSWPPHAGRRAGAPRTETRRSSHPVRRARVQLEDDAACATARGSGGPGARDASTSAASAQPRAPRPGRAGHRATVRPNRCASVEYLGHAADVPGGVHRSRRAAPSARRLAGAASPHAHDWRTSPSGREAMNAVQPSRSRRRPRMPSVTEWTDASPAPARGRQPAAGPCRCCARARASSRARSATRPGAACRP